MPGPLTLRDGIKVVLRAIDEGNPQLASAYIQHLAKRNNLECSDELAAKLCKALEAGVTLNLTPDQLSNQFESNMRRNASPGVIQPETPAPVFNPVPTPQMDPMDQLIKEAEQKRDELRPQQLVKAKQLVDAVAREDWKDAAKCLKELTPRAKVDPKQYLPLVRAIRMELNDAANNKKPDPSKELADAVVYGINPKGITEQSGTIQTTVLQGRLNALIPGKIPDNIDLMTGNARKFMTPLKNRPEPDLVDLIDRDDKAGKVLVAGESAGLKDNKFEKEMTDAVLEMVESPKPKSPLDAPKPKPEAKAEDKSDAPNLPESEPGPEEPSTSRMGG